MLVVFQNSNVCGFLHHYGLSTIFHYRGIFDVDLDKGGSILICGMPVNGGGVTTSVPEFFSQV